MGAWTGSTCSPFHMDLGLLCMSCRNTSVSYRLNSAFFKTLVVLEIFVFSSWSMQPCFIQVHGLAALVVWFIWMHESQVSCIDSDSNYFHESQWLRSQDLVEKEGCSASGSVPSQGR